MNNGDLYDIILAVLKKESKGNIIKPDRFTDLLVQAHYEYYNQQYEKWSGSQAMVDSLKPFLEVDEVWSYTSPGVFDFTDLNATYKHASAARVSIDGVKIEIVTPVEWNEWSGDVVMQGTATHPLMVMLSDGAKVRPSTVDDILFTYLRKADNEPFFDYYADAQNNIQYFVNGAQHVLLTGEVYRDGTDTGTVTSISRELEWEDFDKINIISIILEKIGVSLQSPEVTQYAMALEQKQNVS